MSFVTQGIILRSIDYGESDRILSVYTLNHGKVSAFVPGARRSKKRFAQALDLFCKFEGSYYSRKPSGAAGGSMLRLGEFHYLDIGMGIRQSLPQIIAACMMLESIQKLTVEHDPQQHLYQLMEQFLARLATTSMTDSSQSIDLPITLLHELSILGFLPQLEHCVRCESSVLSSDATSFFFLTIEGGIVCRKCLPHHPYAPSLPISALKAIQKTLYGHIPVARLRLPTDVSMNLHQVIIDMIEAICGSEMRSRHLLPLMFPKKDEFHAREKNHTDYHTQEHPSPQQKS